MSQNMMITASLPPVSGPGGSRKQMPQVSVPVRFPNTEVSGRRLIASVLDGLVVTFLQSLLVFGVWQSDVGVPNGLGDYFPISITRQLNWPWLFVLAFSYFFLFEAIFGTTPGKLLMGLRVVTPKGGHPALWQIFVRSAVRLLEVMPGLFSMVWIVPALFIWLTPRHQRVGDLLAGTVVADAFSLSLPTSTGIWRIRRAAIALAIAELLAILCLGFSFYVQPYQNAYNWRHGQQPDFLPRNAHVESPSYPQYGQNAQGEQTMTYTVYFLQSQGPSYGFYGSRSWDEYRLTITYRWNNIFVGWEIDPESIKIEPVAE